MKEGNQADGMKKVEAVRNFAQIMQWFEEQEAGDFPRGKRHDDKGGDGGRDDKISGDLAEENFLHDWRREAVLQPAGVGVGQKSEAKDRVFGGFFQGQKFALEPVPMLGKLHSHDKHDDIAESIEVFTLKMDNSLMA